MVGYKSKITVEDAMKADMNNKNLVKRKKVNPREVDNGGVRYHPNPPKEAKLKAVGSGRLK